MTSLLTRFVAQGVEVQAIDPRLIAHIGFCEVVTEDEGQAATVEAEPEETPATQTSLTAEAVDAVEGTP